MGRKTYYKEELGEDIYHKKYDKNLTLQEIADDFELAVSTVYNYLNNFQYFHIDYLSGKMKTLNLNKKSKPQKHKIL